MLIGELATLTGTNATTIRFYERKGLLPQPARTDSGYRQYDEDACVRLAFIQAGQEVGLTLGELRGILEFREQGIVPCEHVSSLIENHERQISRRIQELESLRHELQRLSERAQRLDPAACSADEVCRVIPAAPRASASPQQ